MKYASLSQEGKVVAQSNFERMLDEALENGEYRGMEKGMEKKCFPHISNRTLMQPMKQCQLCSRCQWTLFDQFVKN